MADHELPQKLSPVPSQEPSSDPSLKVEGCKIPTIPMSTQQRYFYNQFTELTLNGRYFPPKSFVGVPERNLTRELNFLIEANDPDSIQEKTSQIEESLSALRILKNFIKSGGSMETFTIKIEKVPKE